MRTTKFRSGAENMCSSVGVGERPRLACCIVRAAISMPHLPAAKKPIPAAPPPRTGAAELERQVLGSDLRMACLPAKE
jgi:hypothetical protein